MILHLFWIIPLCLFFISFLYEPRRMLNAYLLIYSLGMLAIALVGFSIVNIEQALNQQVALFFLLLVAILIPISVILSMIYLIFNGRQMISLEGHRLANLLSLFYGLAIALTLGLHLLPQRLGFPLNSLLFFFDFLLLYGSFLYLSHIFYSAFYNAWPIRKEPDYIIVLGSGLLGDKVPPLLAQRLDKGQLLYQKFGQRPQIIVSGGQGPDEKVAEASAMAAYLLEKGVPSEDILLEKQSKTTQENLIFSKTLMKKDSQVLVVTNSFHALRAGIYMKRLGLKGRSVGSKTALYYLPSALIRENMGLFVMYWKWHASLLILFLLPQLILSIKKIIHLFN
ncbi:YdcF family protein [Streptococcus oricebi]|uniref:DUF218 domain-containing protein n=1 Tax=Streptococcus oricebi TaxID=1547447 RepID=A0ABS5B311_9STRE|nr:YdcF family protein [Streptococcus oricebi]MBP2623197.1 hypothetical protein [Streptococcus oricebi]